MCKRRKSVRWKPLRRAAPPAGDARRMRTTAMSRLWLQAGTTT